MKVIGIGNCCVDFIIGLEKMPAENGFARFESQSWQGGGKVPTALAVLGRMGILSSMIAKAGADPYSRFAAQDLRFSGVDTELMIREADAQTGFCVCIAEKSTGNRNYIGNFDATQSVQCEDLKREWFDGIDFLHIDALTPATELAAQWTHESGGKVVIDADRFRDDLERSLNCVDVFIGSEYYFKGAFQDTDSSDPARCMERIPELLTKHAEIVIITLGERGCVGADRHGCFWQPAFTTLPVVDTTGAGDVFHGAYIAALCMGKDTRESARFASATSAIKCCAAGGRAGIPTREHVESFLRNGSIELSWQKERLEHYKKAVFEKE